MKKQAATPTVAGMVTLYAVGIGPQQFTEEHAKKLLAMENTQWSDSPKGAGEKAEKSADDSTNQEPAKG